MSDDKQLQPGFYRRDVNIIIDQVGGCIAALNNLEKFGKSKELAVARTELETAKLWLKELAYNTPEV